MHPKISSFLRDRDRARARGDSGIDRAITADLRRYGVPDDATLQDPQKRTAGLVGEPVQDVPVALEREESVVPPEAVEKSKRRGRPPKPRCEHDRIADRCVECAEAEVAEDRTE